MLNKTRLSTVKTATAFTVTALMSSPVLAHHETLVASQYASSPSLPVVIAMIALATAASAVLVKHFFLSPEKQK